MPAKDISAAAETFPNAAESVIKVGRRETNSVFTPISEKRDDHISGTELHGDGHSGPAMHIMQVTPAILNFVKVACNFQTSYSPLSPRCALHLRSTERAACYFLPREYFCYSTSVTIQLDSSMWFSREEEA